MERYAFLGNIFDIDKAKELVREKPIDTIDVDKVKGLALQLIFHLEDSDGNVIEDNAPKNNGPYSMNLGTSVKDPKWALQHADLDRPVIWFHSPEFSMLIDGYHRLYRAWKEGKGLKVQFISTKQEAKEILIDWVTKTCPIKRWFK